MVAHMHVDTHLDDDRLRHAINAHVTEGISIARLETCRDDFHARFDAVSKRYLYVIATTRFEPVFGRTQQHWTNHPLDLPRMRAAAALMRGTHDFKAFGNTGSPRKTTVRTLHALHFLVHRQRIAFVVQADGFLYNMVRTIAGTLLDVGRGKRDPACVSRAFESLERKEVGATAPARGLYFLSAQYDESVLRGVDTAGIGRPGVFPG
jgi:tRNA pseudouridine38-40 synthase